MKKYFLLSLLAILLNGCLPTLTAQTMTVPATFSPPTATSIPTAIPDTPTATPIPPLTDEGPWLVHYLGGELSPTKFEVVITNLDGSGYHRVLLPAISEKLEISPAGSPKGPSAAIRITNQDLELNEALLTTSILILSLPDGQIIHDIPLVGEQAQSWLEENPPSITQGLASTVLWAPYRWSPNGRYLAFSGALDSESTDVYIYDMVEEQITRLTDGPKEAVIHSWSPDSQWIIHESALFYDTPTRVVYASWAASVSGEVVRLDYGPFNLHPIIGWESEETLITYSEYFEGNSDLLRSIHLPTGESKILFEEDFSSSAYSPLNSTYLINSQPGFGGTSQRPNGIYSLNLETGEIEMLIPGNYLKLAWHPALKMFSVETVDVRGSFFFDEFGEITCETTNLSSMVSISPDGEWLFFDDFDTLFTKECELIRRIDARGQALWLPDSSGFMFFAISKTQVENEVNPNPVYLFRADNNWEPELINPNASLPGYDQVIFP